MSDSKIPDDYDFTDPTHWAPSVVQQTADGKENKERFNTVEPKNHTFSTPQKPAATPNYGAMTWEQKLAEAGKYKTGQRPKGLQDAINKEDAERKKAAAANTVAVNTPAPQGGNPPPVVEDTGKADVTTDKTPRTQELPKFESPFNFANIMSGIGAGLSATAHGGSGGQYGQAYGDTAFGKEQAAQAQAKRQEEAAQAQQGRDFNKMDKGAQIQETAAQADYGRDMQKMQKAFENSKEFKNMDNAQQEKIVKMTMDLSNQSEAERMAYIKKGMRDGKFTEDDIRDLARAQAGTSFGMMLTDKILSGAGVVLNAIGALKGK